MLPIKMVEHFIVTSLTQQTKELVKGNDCRHRPANSRKYNLNFIDKKFKHLSCVFYVVAPHLLAVHCHVNFPVSIG